MINIYKNYLEGLEDHSKWNLDNIEHDFLIENVKAVSELKKHGYSFSVNPEISNTEISLEKQEVLNIVGLNHVRWMNEPFSELDIIENDYLNGLLIYARNKSSQVCEDVYFNNYRMLTRFTMKVSHKALVGLGDNINNEREESHLIVFEHVFKDLDEELVINLKESKEATDYAVYGEWKIVDIDGFFEGNSFNRKVAKNTITG